MLVNRFFGVRCFVGVLGCVLLFGLFGVSDAGAHRLLDRGFGRFVKRVDRGKASVRVGTSHKQRGQGERAGRDLGLDDDEFWGVWQGLNKNKRRGLWNKLTITERKRIYERLGVERQRLVREDLSGLLGGGKDDGMEMSVIGHPLEDNSPPLEDNISPFAGSYKTKYRNWSVRRTLVTAGVVSAIGGLTAVIGGVVGGVCGSGNCSSSDDDSGDGSKTGVLFGQIVQLSGTAGCVSETGTGGLCQDGVALDGAEGIVVSPDGHNAYATSLTSGVVAVFDRNATTGELTQKAGTAGCVSEDGTGGACQDGVALNGASSIAVSPDGQNVYATASTSGAVVIFDRNATTGELTQKAGTAGCVSETGTAGACQDGVALNGASSIAVSSDGNNAYVTSEVSSAVAVFDRNTTTGELSQGSGGCVSEDGTGGACQDGVALSGASSIVVSSDGQNVYTAAFGSNAIVIFDRNTTTGELTQKPGTAGCVSETGTAGACQNGVALDFAHRVVISPDGDNVYASSLNSDAVVVFDRSTTSGALTQKAGAAGCISEDGTGGACQDGIVLDAPGTLMVSPDGKNVYVPANGSSSVVVFNRDSTNGELSQQPSPDGCVSVSGTGGSCQISATVDSANSVTVSPDGKNVYAAANVADAITVFNRLPGFTGNIIQLAGTAGCVSEDGTGGSCQDGVGLGDPEAMTVSPDGKNAYAASANNAVVAVFDRNSVTGELTQKSGTAGCISDDGTSGLCQDGIALLGANDVTVSPDGRNVYASAIGSDAVVVFDRNSTTGELTQKAGTAGCISDDGTGGLCQVAPALFAANSVTVSPDGRNVYATARNSIAGGAVVVFDRNSTTGELIQKAGTAGCISDDGTGGLCQVGTALISANSVTVSSDGRNVYATTSGAVVVFDRNSTTGELTQKAGTAGCISEDGSGGLCQDGTALLGANSVTVSPDGRNVYAASANSDAVVVFDRNPTTGELTQKAGTAGCISEDGTGGLCQVGTELNGALAVTVSTDGLSFYVAANGSNAVSAFDRDPTTGALIQKTGTAGCISATGTGGSCQVGVALNGANWVAMSPDGQNIYVASITSTAVTAFNRT